LKVITFEIYAQNTYNLYKLPLFIRLQIIKIAHLTILKSVNTFRLSLSFTLTFYELFNILMATLNSTILLNNTLFIFE